MTAPHETPAGAALDRAGPEHLSFIVAAQEATALLSGVELNEERRLALEQALATHGDEVWVLTSEGEPAGYFWLERRGEGIAFMLDFYVAPERRRQGVATDLLASASARAGELACHTLRFAVSHANQPAEHFFRERGARPVDISADGHRTEYELDAAGRIERTP